MDDKLFREDPLEKLVASAELQERFVIVSLKHWIAALIIGLLTVCILAWSVVARIDEFAEGQGVVVGREVYGIVPFAFGASIRNGMAVHINVSSADVTKYGYLQGTVKQVFPYLEPIPEQIANVPLPEIQEYITLKKPYVIFVVEPVVDPTTSTGYRWTTKDGPPFPIWDGTITTVKVVINEKRPISYLIPGIQ